MFIQRLAVAVSNRVASFLHRQTGKEPWTPLKYILGV